jgi:ATP-binding cassette subfamily B protein
VRQKVLTSVRIDMYEHLQRMSLKFFARHASGNLLSRITNDVSYIQNLLNDELFELVASAIKVSVILVFLMLISPKLTLLCLGIIPAVTIIFLLLKQKVYEQNRELQETQAKLSGQIQQNFTGMKLIQAEVIEEQMREDTLAASRKLEQVGIKREVIGISGDLFTTLSSYIPILAIIWGVGGYLVIQRSITLGELLAYNQYLFGLITPITGFFRFSMNLQAGYAALDRIGEILDQQPEIEDSPTAQTLDEPIDSIVFENVRLEFTKHEYTPTPNNNGQSTDTKQTLVQTDSHSIVALDNISFSITSGQKVALVGPSGAGKTSILNLLLRFYEPTTGRILINKRDIREYTLHSLRRKMAYVAQELFMFNTNIRHNLSLEREISDAELERALRFAEIQDFVCALDKGLDTAVEERGQNFSGGQRQRLALARALAKPANCYLLDEATSALDAQTEVQIMQNLRTALQNQIVLIIAHRFSFLELVDRILVIANGRLIEDDTPQELLNKGGLFCSLYSSQKN